MTQGAVAQHVRGLEARLSLRLFERRPRSLALTDAGRSYHQEISRAFSLLRHATARLRPEPGRVTISVTPTFASKWLIPRLPAFTAAHGGIDLRVLATESISSFRADGIDLAVRQGVPPFGASLDVELLFDQEIVAVCAPALLPVGARPLGIEDLSRFMLLHDTHNLWPEFLEAAFGDRLDPSVKGMSFSQTSLSIDAALAGQGIALASRFLVTGELAAGRLVEPFRGAFDGGRGFYLLAPRRPPRNGAVDAVWNWLLDARER